ncbi:aspartate racemase [Sinobacterium caligoides]|uniref:Aspartate racemase n=1 Tax=Sinobacterium caligoides TaxID=933926 RepID=A0A3N2E1W2_9GAMM|nr:amino acid racemase [Sinobacterium caligoides]ROS05555.1 aspartate racemase [Sinobacterium caligoides]
MHKKIGIIGGLSPESTVSYYLHITRSYVEKFGDYGYPEIVIYSVNLKKYHYWRSEGRWDLITEDLVAAANKLKVAGADFALIATNTMHKVFNEVQLSASLPLIDLINATAKEVADKKVKTVALLGTKFTMSENFYRQRLESHGLKVIVPSLADQEIIHRIIVDELVRGVFLQKSKAEYISIIGQLLQQGAEGVILGCTEIPLLIKPEDCHFPVFDTAKIHAEEALLCAVNR